ncbi:DUF4846 domain-containing protein [candidate division WOR-3 bacterium]|nr:DUF4846 domain-containing protein [candidate division WOR-3 bacterium]
MFLKMMGKLYFILLFSMYVISLQALPQSFYAWLERYDKSECIVNRVKFPDGYKRVSTNPGSFKNWLRYLPLKKGNPPVYLFNGLKKTNQSVHFAVMDMDVGVKDLQQCADVIIRLRAEYLYSIGKYDSIYFNLTNGDEVMYNYWIRGFRPKVKGNKVKWIKNAAVDSSYACFREYLNFIFTYAGSYSLCLELNKVEHIEDMEIGDVFIRGGFPGHAVIVIDIAMNEKTGEKLFLIAQSYMPAQELHILVNPNDSELNPWYELDFGEVLYTPEWIFNSSDLMRF